MADFICEDMKRTNVWKRALCIFLSVILLFGSLFELITRTAYVQNKVELHKALSSYTKDIIETRGAEALDKGKMAEDNTLVSIKNSDDSHTAYIFSEPISFTDKNGQIRTKDISIEKINDENLIKKGYTYTNGQNDYRILFPENIKTGIKASVDDISFLINPLGISQQVLSGKKESVWFQDEKLQAFTYENAYGDDTKLRFYPELNGIKDEIILEDDKGTYDFSYSLKVEGCSAVLNDDGKIDLTYKDTVIQSFSVPYAYDSLYEEGDPDSPSFTNCYYTLEEKEPKKDNVKEYVMTLHVPKEWLSSSDRQFPVTIDPANINVSNYFDNGIYSSKANTCYGTSTTTCFGRSSTYGYGRVLEFFVPPTYINSDVQINYAYYYLRETTGRTPNTYLTPYMVKTTWSENTTWNSQPEYYDFSGQPTKLINGNSHDVSSSKFWYAFDIQTAVYAWAQGWVQNLGLIFISNEETDGNYNWRAFASREYSSSSMRPYVVINYENDHTPPTAQDVSGNPTYWTNDNVTLSVDGASDGEGSGLAPEAYSFSTNPDVQHWQASNQKTFDENCTVYIHLRDNWGNVAYLGAQNIHYIDKTKPSSPVVTGMPTEWTNESYTLHASSTDDASGIWAYSFAYENSHGEWTFTEDKQLAYNGNFYVYAIDHAGNVSSPTVVTVDKYDGEEPDIIDIRAIPSDEDDMVRVEVIAEDDISGIAGYKFNQDNSFRTENYADVDADAPYSVVEVKDNAGNIAEGVNSQGVPQFYMEGQLVGIVNSTRRQNETIYYRFEGSNEWEEYSYPFAIPAFEDTTVYAKIGETGIEISKDLTSFSKYVGAYEESNTDFSLVYKNVGFDFLRSYNSTDGKWFFSTDSKLKKTNSIMYTVTLPDESELVFVKKNNHLYVNELNGYELYIYDDTEGKPESYIVNIEDISYHYNRAKQLDYITDKYAHTISIERTANTITVSDSTGRSYVLNLNIDRHITSITDPAGGVINYAWDQNGNLTSVTDQAGVLIGQYSYSNVSGFNNLVMTKSMDKTIQYNSDNRVRKLLYDSGAYTNYTYDDDNRTTTTISSTDATTTTVYNDAFLVTSTRDEEGNETEYTYNERYQVTSERVGNKTTTYGYDSWGNVARVIDEDGKRTTCSYDSNNRLILEDDGEHFTYYLYDENGELALVAKVRSDYDGYEPPQYDPTMDYCDTVSYTYENGLLTQTVDSKSGETTTYLYDEYGNTVRTAILKTVDGATTLTVTNSTYDLFGNTLTSSTNDNSSVTAFDAAGRTILSTVNGETTRTIYDSFGRIVREIGPEDYDENDDGLPENNTYANNGKGSFYNYADNNTLTSETNRLGKTTNYYYNSTGNKIREEFDIYKFYYRDHGELIKVKVNDVDKVTYDYDDDTHLLQSVTYANGTTIYYTYDNNRNLVSQRKNSESVPFVRYVYNDDGELVEKVNEDTGFRYVYGENDTVTVYHLLDNTVLQTYATTSSEDDEVNNISESHFGTPFSSRVTSNQTIFAPDTENCVSYDFTANDEGNVLSETYKNNGVVSFSSAYTYDGDKNITQKTYSLSGNNTLSINNVYDNKNRITGTGFGCISQTFTYDSGDQLIRTDDVTGNYTETYQYDSRGNILSKNKYAYTDGSVSGLTPAESKTFAYTDSNWEDLLTSVNGESLTYDASGNLLSYGNRTFTWIAGRQLMTIRETGSSPHTYSYDYDENGIRTLKSVDGISTFFNTRNGVILSQTDGTNTLYFQYDNNGAPLGFIYNGNQYLYLTNQMGDVIAITDRVGSIIARYYYDSWGKITAIEPETENDATQQAIAEINPLRYRGYYYDSETGYYYLQSRYYDPEIGRFINADKLEVASITKATTSGCNLFAYCSNSPICSFDYSGEFAPNIIIGAIFGAVSGAFSYILSQFGDYILQYKKVSIGRINKKYLVSNMVIGAFSGMLSYSSQKKLAIRVINSVLSWASSRLSGASLLDAFVFTIITFIMTNSNGYGNLLRKFSKKSANMISHTKKFTRTQIRNIAKTVSKEVSYYCKSNFTLYKNFTKEFLQTNLKQWSVAYGITVWSRR